MAGATVTDAPRITHWQREQVGALSAYELVSLTGQLETLFAVATALLNAPNMHETDGRLNAAGRVFENAYGDVAEVLHQCKRRIIALKLSETEDADMVANEQVRYAMEDIDCVPLAMMAMSMAKAKFGEDYR